MSGYVMNFPNTWEEYEEQYGFNDTEQVYTNGSRLIQSLRVKQWLEHIEVSEDAISRKAVEKMLDESWVDGFEYSGDLFGDLESMPSVIPQVPSEDCISREWVLSQGKYYYNGKGEQEYAIPIQTIKSAPSVIPQMKEEEEMKQCPKCGRYMTWYVWQSECYWKCICGYDTRNINYTKGVE